MRKEQNSSKSSPDELAKDFKCCLDQEEGPPGQLSCSDNVSRCPIEENLVDSFGAHVKVLFVCVCMCLYMFVCVYECLCVCVFVYINICIHI